MNKEKLAAEARKVERAVELAYQNGGIYRYLADDVWNLIECINKLDEPKKVVIPHFVADYYNDYKNQELTFEEWFESPPLNKGSRTENETFKWFLNNEHETNLERQFILADIIVHGLDGYEVEKEKLYRIKFSDNQYASRFNNEKISSTLTDEELAAQYTESEIKAIDKRFWSFAEEVKE